MKLKDILKEAAISEPPESVLKGALDLFRKQTNLPVAEPTILKNTPAFITYTSSLIKYITGALMPLMVSDADLIVTVTPMKTSIGGYRFQFDAKLKTMNGNTVEQQLLNIYYMNNKFKVK